MTETALAYTPGPYAIVSDGEGKPNAIVTSLHYKDEPEEDICEVYGGNADQEHVREGNARLIAAALRGYEKHCGDRAIQCAEADLLGAALGMVEEMLTDAETLNEPYRNEAICERARALLASVNR